MPKVKLAPYVIAAGALLVAGSSAYAQNGRYSMTPTKDGILRLDTQTGAVSLCNRASGTWSCKGVDRNEQNSESELNRLKKDNRELRSQLEQRGFGAAPHEGGKIEIPSEEDVDKAMDFMEKLLNRFKGMVEDLKKNKKDDSGVPL